MFVALAVVTGLENTTWTTVALSAMAKRGEWDDLAHYLTDEMMNRIVPQGTYDEIVEVLTEWYSGLCTGMTLQLPADENHDEQLARLIDKCHQIPAGGVSPG